MDLYVNARFLPMTGEHDTFEAMLVGDDGTIAFTGSLEQARDRAAQLRRTASGSPVRQIDCEGHCVMPGLIDPHSTAADLSGARDFDDVARLLADFARRRGWLKTADTAAPVQPDDGVILIGVGLDDATLVEHRMPDRVVLDRVSATLPVVVNHVSGHNLACNTRWSSTMSPVIIWPATPACCSSPASPPTPPTRPEAVTCGMRTAGRTAVAWSRRPCRRCSPISSRISGWICMRWSATCRTSTLRTARRRVRRHRRSRRLPRGFGLLSDVRRGCGWRVP